MKSKSGFTIVEIVITITVIAVLTSIAVFSFISVQQQARDSARASSMTIIAESLEKYFEKEGYYPSPRLLSNTISANTGSVVGDLLLIDSNVLVSPNATSGTTNSLSTSLTNTTYRYTATSTINNTRCQTLAVPGCTSFVLSYIQEEDGATINVRSRNN